METSRSNQNNQTGTKSNQIEVVKTLYVAPSLEPVIYSSPTQQRKEELEQFLYHTGSINQFPMVWEAVKNHNPLMIEHGERQGYSTEQRKWLKYKRDEGKDQAPFPHIETRQQLQRLGLATNAYVEALTKLEAHHIYPQSYLQAYLGLKDFPKLINSAENGLTLSRMSHVGFYWGGVNESRHPDINEATRRYGFDPILIKRTLQNHWELAKEGVKFWVSKDDQAMFKIARERTEKMRMKNK